MAVFRIDKTRDYTVMANHHLRNKALSLKAKGLLSLMLSLPEDWDYTTKGLSMICKDGVDSIFHDTIVKDQFWRIQSWKSLNRFYQNRPNLNRKIPHN